MVSFMSTASGFGCDLELLQLSPNDPHVDGWGAIHVRRRKERFHVSVEPDHSVACYVIGL